MDEYNSPELNQQGSKLLYDLMIFSGDLGGKPNFNLQGKVGDRVINIDVNISIEEKEGYNDD